MFGSQREIVHYLILGSPQKKAPGVRRRRRPRPPTCWAEVQPKAPVHPDPKAHEPLTLGPPSREAKKKSARRKPRRDDPPQGTGSKKRHHKGTQFYPRVVDCGRRVLINENGNDAAAMAPEYFQMFAVPARAPRPF